MILPRTTVTEDGWSQAIDRLAGGSATLLGLWGDPPNVHMALLDESQSAISPSSLIAASTESIRASAPGIRQRCGWNAPSAICSDSTPWDAPDARPWLDHGVWDGGATKPRLTIFLPTEGEGLHQIPVGPVHAGIIEPGHFRFTANGEHVVRLEQRLGYVHKGIESLMAGATLDDAAKLAGRTSGDSTVAYSYAFAHGRRGRAGDRAAAARESICAR